MDFRASDIWASYLTSVGWHAIRLQDGGSAYIYRIPILGPVMRIIPDSTVDVRRIRQLEKRHRVLFTRIDFSSPVPSKTIEAVTHAGFIRDPWSVNTDKTYVIDLTKSENELFRAMSKNWRRSIRLSEKNHLKILQKNDIQTLITIWQKRAKKKGYAIETPYEMRVLWNVLNTQRHAALFFAMLQHTPIATAWVIPWEHDVHLWHIAYVDTYAQHVPNCYLLWHIMRVYKKRGYKTVHLGMGPSLFKKQSGATIVPLPGFYIRYANPLLAPFFRLFTSMNPALIRTGYRKLHNIRYGTQE